MKKIMHKSLALLLSVLMLFTAVGCEKKENTEITNLLLEFEYACNSLDVEALLECLEPSVGDSIRFASSLAANLLGVPDIDDLFDGFLAYLMYDSSSDFIVQVGTSGVDFLESIDIELQEIERLEDYEDHAIAHTVVTAEILGQQYVRKAEFLLVYYIDRWCISEFSIL